jgi:curli biogenesis system outer membrane secretion channel CsgG
MRCAAAAVFTAAVALSAPHAAWAGEPSVAVIVVTSEGAAQGIGGGFDPGKALTTLLTDRLVELGKLSVVEREHIERVFDEQKLSQSGDFSTQDGVKLGHMVQANFLIVGRVVHLDKVGSNAGGAGALLSKVPLNIGGAGASSEKVHLQVGVRLIDANTGRIVKAINFDQTQSGTSFVVGDVGTHTEIYSSQQFTASVIGKLVNAAANEIARKVSEADLAAGPSGPALEAAIIALDGANVIINKGSRDGVKAGMFFDTFHRIVARDPSSGKPISTDVPDGNIQITSVGPNSSVARKVSGSPAVAGIARTP